MLKFSDINGRQLKHKSAKFLFRRLLSFHAKCSYKNALKKGWITEDEFKQFQDFEKLSAGAMGPAACRSISQECGRLINKEIASRIFSKYIWFQTVSSLQTFCLRFCLKLVGQLFSISIVAYL